MRIAGVTYGTGLQNYFSTRAANMTAMLSANDMPGTVGGLTSSTSNCSNSACSPIIGFTNKDGAARLGRICWTRNSGTLTFGVSTAGDPCNSPATAADPLLVYNTSANGWRIDRGAFSRSDTTCPGTQICYTGVAIIYNANSVSIEETVTSLCGVANSNCTAGNEKFPTNDLMALLTPGNVTVAATTTNVVARVMAMLYAGTDFVSRSVVPATPTRIVGGVAASRFCFGCGGACPGGTSNAPEIYQAPLNGSSLNATPPVAHDARGLPNELLALSPSLNGQAPKHWRVESVPRLWLECRPIAPSATLPTTPTGACGYN